MYYVFKNDSAKNSGTDGDKCLSPYQCVLKKRCAECGHVF